MNFVVHKIVLQSEEQFGRRLPPHHLGLLLAELPLAIRASVSMSFQKRSQAQGNRPDWLERAADVRFVEHQGVGESILCFEAPSFGEAAPEVFAQQSLIPDADDRPNPEDTAFDVFGDVLADVQQRNTDSSHFDQSLLRRMTKFRRVFRNGPFTEIDFTSRRYPQNSPARLTQELVDSAQVLLGDTPPPQRVRIVGQLDGLIASTQRFSVLLDSGEKIMGVFAGEQADAMQKLWRKRVIVMGTAVYRASGRLLRIDAEAVRPGENEGSVFSRMPAPPNRKLDVSELRRPQGPRSGMAAIIGKWPGDETDEQIQEALKRLS